MTVQAGLCRAWSESQIACFLTHRLIPFICASLNMLIARSNVWRSYGSLVIYGYCPDIKVSLDLFHFMVIQVWLSYTMSIYSVYRPYLSEPHREKTVFLYVRK